MIKSSLFNKSGRKSSFLKLLSDYIATSEVKLPPVSVSTIWNSSYKVALYHVTRIQLYEGFYKAKKAQGVAVEWIIKMVTHKTIYSEIRVQLYFIKENCLRLMAVLTSLEAKDLPLACTVYNTLEDLRLY